MRFICTVILGVLIFNLSPISHALADEPVKIVQPALPTEAVQTKEQEKSDHFYKQYVGITGGLFIPNNDGSSSNLGLKNFENGYNVGLIVGGRYCKYFGLETNINVNSSDTKHPIQSGNKSLTGSVTIASTSIAAIGIIPQDNFELFGGVGGGIYYNQMKTSSTTSGITTKTSGLSQEFGYHFLGGINIDLTKRLALRIAYKYYVVKPEFKDIDTNANRIINFGGSTVDGGILFRYR